MGSENTYDLKLYICGSSMTSKQAETNLRNMCKEFLEGNYTLEVIDVLKDTDRANADNILATPALIKAKPSPSIRIIGDISDSEAVLKCIE